MGVRWVQVGSKWYVRGVSEGCHMCVIGCVEGAGAQGEMMDQVHLMGRVRYIYVCEG